jgi:hypothetical protein
LLGQGTSGAASTTNGQGGSGGANSGAIADVAGAYGGGGSIGGGASGAVRIIWPGTTRSFPSTNTGDL